MWRFDLALPLTFFGSEVASEIRNLNAYQVLRCLVNTRNDGCCHSRHIAVLFPLEVFLGGVQYCPVASRHDLPHILKRPAAPLHARPYPDTAALLGALRITAHIVLTGMCEACGKLSSSAPVDAYIAAAHIAAPAVPFVSGQCAAGKPSLGFSLPVTWLGYCSRHIHPRNAAAIPALPHAGPAGKPCDGRAAGAAFH